MKILWSALLHRATIIECRSETCCAQLAENTARKNDAKNRHLGTIPQICRAISSQLRHVSTIGKKLIKQQYLLHMSPQCGELRHTSGWDRFVSLGHPCKFQPVSRLGSVTARQSSSGRQPNFAGLNRGRHLHSAGRPSRWALAHISSSYMPLVHILKDQIVRYFVSRMHMWSWPHTLLLDASWHGQDYCDFHCAWCEAYARSWSL